MASNKIVTCRIARRESKLSRATNVHLQNRPDSHEVGDLGIIVAERFFVDHHWVVNRIHSDYGEDLMVQPRLGQQVEKHRMLVQVKGIGRGAKRRSVKLKTTDLYLWQFLGEPFVLVVWDQRDDALYIKWMNQKRDPQSYTDGQEISINIKNMHVLDGIILNYLASELRNIEYKETLGRLSNYIESRGGYRSASSDVISAKIAATQIGIRMLAQDGVISSRGRGKWGPDAKFLRSHLDEIILFASELGNSRGRLIRVGSLTWALFITEYNWNRLYNNSPNSELLWIVANVVEALVTRDHSFIELVRSRVRNVLDVSTA